MAHLLAERIGSTAFAFRGYNVTNLGRSRELLDHAAYGSIVERWLRRAGAICAETLHKPVDLVARVRESRETSLECYDEAIALLAAMELAQLQLLENFFGVRYADAQMAFGFSLGELVAVAASAVFELEQALQVPLRMAADCAALADGVTLGVLFSRGRELDLAQVTRLLLEINLEGDGVAGMSAILAPNTVLLMGQGTTLDRFSRRMQDYFPERLYLRKNSDRWPPMHTPLVWQRHIPNRVGLLLHTLPGGVTAPHPPLFSLVTGGFDYNDYNGRSILIQWVDHPQRLWDAVYETLSSGVETVIHVGPDPNLVPATFQRLKENVAAQLQGSSLKSLSLRATAQAVRRTWLTAILPSRTALLRAPFIEHIILEDWLLAQEVA